MGAIFNYRTAARLRFPHQIRSSLQSCEAKSAVLEQQHGRDRNRIEIASKKRSSPSMGVIIDEKNAARLRIPQKKRCKIKPNRVVRGSNATFIVEFDGISTPKAEVQEVHISGFDAEKLPL